MIESQERLQYVMVKYENACAELAEKTRQVEELKEALLKISWHPDTLGGRRGNMIKIKEIADDAINNYHDKWSKA